MKLIKEPVVNERAVRRGPRPKLQACTVLPFEKLTALEKRVLVARDVLLQLDAGRLVAKRDQYLSLRTGGVRIDAGSTASFEAVDPDRALHNKCSVCAVAAVFVALGRRRGGVTMLDIEQMLCGIAEYAEDIFPRGMLADIERYFEVHDALRRLRHLDDEERLRIIMQNIIDNKGRFFGRELLSANSHEMRTSA